ncbi:MAG: autotransporter [Solirubrobacteraceae bacterium]
MLASFGGATPAGATSSIGGGQHSRTGTARSARALDATDTGRLHYVKSSGSLLLEEGTAQGTLPGSMRASCDLSATVSASFTIYTHGGTIKGHGTATPHGSGIYESFAGTLTITGGTGRYAHARGHAGLYGTFDRRTYALTLQTTGSLSY